MRQRRRLHRLRTRAAARPRRCGRHAGRQHPGPSSRAARGPRLGSTSLPLRRQAAPAQRGRALSGPRCRASRSEGGCCPGRGAPRRRPTPTDRQPERASGRGPPPLPSPPLPAARPGQQRSTLASTSRPLFLKLLMRWFSKPGFSAMAARGSGGGCSCGGGGGESSGRGRRGRNARSVTPGARGGRGGGGGAEEWRAPEKAGALACRLSR